MPIISRIRPTSIENETEEGVKYRYPAFIRTTGIYGHLPKFYKCRGPLEDFGDEYETCPKPNWHLSYSGYLRLMTKRNIYTFWYMGGNPRKKIFERIRYNVRTRT